ncbi:glycoside hydrolase superfamily [Sporodiniella umbellata]|nr:glycoside hydrolase superfamily [Sporodiniella umbellata]
MELNGPWFIDETSKRTVLFKGINLSGGAKLPNGMPSHESKNYWVDYDSHVDFVGRPFPLNEADEHLSRIANYGFNLIRFVITWESLEHEGPGIYDEAYIDYLIQILRKCEHYKLKVYMDPHQDCWSRHCGGSGHPGWTLALVGLNPLNFLDTKAAIVHNLYPNPEEFPKMVWNTNYQKLAVSTLFTLFFAGNKLAPKCRINGVNIQDYLQEHYINCLAHVAERVKEHHLTHVVIGYDTMNEPGRGYLSLSNITSFDSVDTDFKMGLIPTAFQGMLLGSGIPAEVEEWEFAWSGPKKTGTVTVDPQGKQAWLSDLELKEADERFGWKRASSWPAGCIWANHGVWDKESQKALVPDYFSVYDHQPVRYMDEWVDYFKRYVDAIRIVDPKAFIFVQPPVLEVPPKLDFATERLVYSPHWYDGLTLVKKKWSNYNIDFINLSRGKYGNGPLRFARALRLGEKAIRQCFADQLKTLQDEGKENIGNYPCILGEIGIPYDMETGVSDKKHSFLGNFWSFFLSLFQIQQLEQSSMNSPDSNQNKAMDANLNALEQNLLNYTLWNYVPDNEPKWGDRWNGEDLSIWQNNTADKYLDKFKSSPSSVATASTIVVEDLDKKDKADNASIDTQSLNDTASLNSSPNVRELPCLYRPHPRATAGIPGHLRFVSPTKKTPALFEYSFALNVDCDTPTEIHVPSQNFPLPPKTEVSVSVGEWKITEKTDDYWVMSWSMGSEIPETAEPKLTLQGVSVQK